MAQLSHLSLFVQDLATGNPIARFPFYAEIGLTGAVEPGGVDQRFQGAIENALRQVDAGCEQSDSCRSAVVDSLSEILSRLLAPAVRDKLQPDPAGTQKLFTTTIVSARNAAGSSLGSLSAEVLKRQLESAFRQAAQAQQIALVQTPAVTKTMTWTYPLGVLATDHVGYLSFDLTRVSQLELNAVAADVEARKSDAGAALKTTVLLYPLIPGAQPLDALAQGRFTDSAIVVRADLANPDLPVVVQNLGMLSMQNPDLTDWGLSPTSFAVNPGTLVGQDGCESLLPANVALQEFYFYEVVRLTDPAPQQIIPVGLQGKVRVGVIHEYRLAWYPLGHSLGQILYSMPLAPGESVNLAVIDWTRRDDAQRAEHTTMDEQLVHNEHRDRTITETVNAAIQEYQQGSSFMAGLAGSVGLSAALGSGVGLAAGLAGSLGGSSADSSGSRNIAANTVQNLSDNITQASASMRELQSTVVVHSVQAENEAIQTRTVVNYNHSHALTILYYEVLRHFRVVTERVRTSPALLVHYDLQAFSTNAPILLNNLAVLRVGLLEQKYAPAFDAMDRIMMRAKVSGDSPAPAPPPASPLLHFFNFDMKTGGMFADTQNHSSARVTVRAILLPSGIKLNGDTDMQPPGAFTQPNANNSFSGWLAPGTEPVPWANIDSIQFSIFLDSGDEDWSNVSFQHVRVTGIDLDGNEVILIDKDYNTDPFAGHLILANNAVFLLPTRRPPVPAPPPPIPADQINDQALVDELVDHLNSRKEYYNRLIWMSEDPLARATRFDGMAWDGSSTLLDHLENKAVEIIGSWLAFPTNDKKLDDAIQVLDQIDPRGIEIPVSMVNERLVTVPTRGVFAEAKLGHCNASEEIDNTRFWDWQTSPIPHLAPDIAPVTPVTPQPQQQNLQPTPFPQSLVNIVNPPSEPDPTGLSAALTVLGTPNIFRDMSGQAAVADLLKKLSDNSISIAQASQQAKAIQSQFGGTGSGGGTTGTQRALPTQPSATNRDLQDLGNVANNLVGKNLLTQGQAQDLVTQAAQGVANQMASVPPPALPAGNSSAATANSGAGSLPSGLDSGNFKQFVDANRLDLKIADVLRALDSYPSDSWAKQMATFAYHELEVGNVIAIVTGANKDKVIAQPSVLPSDYAKVNADAELVAFDGPYNGLTNTIGGPGAYKAYILLKDTFVDQGMVPGPPREALALAIAHELTHARNRDFFRAFEGLGTTDPAVYVDPAYASSQPGTAIGASRVMEEMICDHVAWRVREDLRARSLGTTPRIKPDTKGFFKFCLDQEGIFSLTTTGNDYLAHLKSAGAINEQMAWWMRFAGQNALFHDDPAKTAAVRQLFENTYNDVQPGFATPTVAEDGGA